MKTRFNLLCLLIMAGLAEPAVASEPGLIERISLFGDCCAEEWSFLPSISADGRYVAYASYGPDVGDDSNGVADVFVHDRATNTTERVSVSSLGEERSRGGTWPFISHDGRYVLFTGADDNGAAAIFLHDRVNHSTERVVQYAGGKASLGGDGRYVAYSSAFAWVPEDTNGVSDVFVHDRLNDTTERVSVDSSGIQGSSWSLFSTMSGDGRYVVFTSASNLAPGDTNNNSDVYVHDRSNRTTELISADSFGNAGSGRSVSRSGGISADGRYVTFTSDNYLAPGYSAGGIFVRDRINETTELVSIDDFGVPGNFYSLLPSMSADGRYVSFSSASSNLVANDTERQEDIFVHDRVDHTTVRVSVDSLGNGGNRFSRGSMISADGRHVAFTSLSKLVPGEYSDLHTFAYSFGSAIELLSDLIDEIQSLNLQNGIANSLDAKLEAATAALEDLNDNNDLAACNALDAFVNAVDNQSGSQISVEDAQELTAATYGILVLLDCG